MSDQEKLIFKNVKASAAQARARELIFSTRKREDSSSTTEKVLVALYS